MSNYYCSPVFVTMEVSRLWYPDRMLSRSRTSPPSFRRIPSSVESCLQWPETAAEHRDGYVRSQQQQQRREEISPTRCNIGTHYDGRHMPYDAHHKATRHAVNSDVLLYK